MARIEPAVRRETLYIGAWVAILSVAMEAVFACIGLWDYTVLCGNALGACGAVLNFFLMGITVQRAVDKDADEAPKLMKLSLTLRTFMLIIFCVIGAVVGCFNLYAVIIPLFFPRIAIFFRREEKNVEG